MTLPLQKYRYNILIIKDLQNISSIGNSLAYIVQCSIYVILEAQLWRCADCPGRRTVNNTSSSDAAG